MTILINTILTANLIADWEFYTEFDTFLHILQLKHDPGDKKFINVNQFEI